MEVLKIFQMEEPISKKVIMSNNSRSLNSSFKDKVEKDTIEKLKKELFLAKSENWTLQRELASTVKEDTENRAKIAELSKKLKELEKPQPKNLEHLQRSIQEKNETIKILTEKINELQIKFQAKNKLETIEKIGDASASKREIEFQKVMQEYEEFLRKMVCERENLIQQTKRTENHLSNLELAFSDLLEKYERAKKIVIGYKNNEEILRNQIADITKLVDNMNEKYDDLKNYAERKISEANAAILNQDKGNIEEVAKLKAKILQSQVKISELEKGSKSGDVQGVSLFAPLKNNLKRKTKC